MKAHYNEASFEKMLLLISQVKFIVNIFERYLQLLKGRSRVTLEMEPSMIESLSSCQSLLWIPLEHTLNE